MGYGNPIEEERDGASDSVSDLKRNLGKQHRQPDAFIDGAANYNDEDGGKDDRRDKDKHLEEKAEADTDS